jgi:DNA-binding transcriptional MocR family regulator
MKMPVNSFDRYPMAWKPAKASLTQPYYRSLANRLEDEIRSGRLAPGTLLPPQRELADFLDINFTTVTRAYNICKQKGLIYGTTGKGTFVAPHASEAVTLAGSELSDDLIELGAVNGFDECSELVEKATRSVIEKGYLRNLYKYSYPAGHPHQLAAGLRWMEQMGVHSDSEHTAIFAGAQNALSIALLLLFSPGDKLATDLYTYSNLIELAKLLRIILIPIEGDQYGMCPEALKKKCSTNKISGIYLIPCCSNPTAIHMPLERRRELAAVIKENELTLIEDDVSAWLSVSCNIPVTSMFDLLPEQSVYICGTTKSLCPGIRVAYMAFAEKYRESILRGLSIINIKTSSLDAEIITELILNGDAYKIAEQKRELASKSCLLFDKYFSECVSGDSPISYFRWLPIRTEKSSHIVERDLQELGVNVHHSERFAVVRDREQSFLRVSLSSAGSLVKLEEGLKILKCYLGKFRK